MKSHKINLILIYTLSFLIIFFFTRCSVKYSFSGASIPPDVKTVSIQYFPNRAPLGPGDLSQRIFDALREKIENQTNLTVINGYGDVDFEGEITDYNTQARTITAEERAEQNRLTISIRIKSTNNANPKWDFDKSFSRYEDYPSTQNISESLENEIINQLVQDIFNQAFVNW